MTALLALSLVAHAADAGWPNPHSFVDLAVGSPWVVSLQAESLLGEEVSGQIGVGIAGADGLVDFASGQQFGANWAIKYRPAWACLGCGGRTAGSFGAGIGGLVTPPPDFKGGGWNASAGLDVDGRVVYWSGHTTGFTAGLEGGVGPAYDFGAKEVSGAAGWGWLLLGVVF
jgi:hypothetical protein